TMVSGAGSYSISVTVADACGNQAYCAVAFTVTDTTPPTINCPGNVAVNNNSGTCGAIVGLPAPAVSDNCTPAGAIDIRYYLASTYNIIQGTGTEITSPYTFAVGTTNVTIKATDAAGNHS